MLTWVVSLALWAAVGAVRCPGSSAWVHASCSVEATAQSSCAAVHDEMLARVRGQHTGAWHDPHNNGTYAVLTETGSELLVTRTSGSKSVGGTTYTDKVLFTFAPSADGGCQITGCSESQGTSVVDFSTNYCNIRNLYCGSRDGCPYARSDLGTKESSVSPSAGAGKDPSACVVGARQFTEAAADIGGFYVDPNHYKKGTFAGTRMLSMRKGDTVSDEITLVGSDDGESFWTLRGRITSKGKFVIDFSPKGGPADLHGAFSQDRLTFSDGNAWSRLRSPDCDAAGCASSAQGHLDGFYTDPNHYRKGSFAGVRMISNKEGDLATGRITLVGSDDGVLFWTLHGKLTHETEGGLVIDFSPKGGPANLAATFSGSSITYQDGNVWSRQAAPDCAHRGSPPLHV